MHTRSAKSEHGLLSHVPGGHGGVHGRHTLSSVSSVSLRLRAHMSRSTYCCCCCASAAGHASMLVQSAQMDTSRRSCPAQVFCMYCPLLAHTRLHCWQAVSDSTLHSADTKRCSPHVSLHDVHCAYLSTAQSLLTKLTPCTHALGHVVHCTELLVPAPVHGGPVRSRLGGQSFWVVHFAHPASATCPRPGHTGSCIVR